MAVKVGVSGYGTIGKRLAEGVVAQKDMELVGVADVAPTLPVKSLKARGMPYKLYCADKNRLPDLEKAGIPVSGMLEDLLSQVDIILDSTPAGVGAKMKKFYVEYGVPAIFQGGEKGEVADVFFHGYANYEKGLGKKYLLLTSCNTTGLIRAVDCLDRAFGVEKVAITIIRRCADPGDLHRGYVDLAKVDPVPSHQATDLMEIMPHVKATGLLVHVPITHGHIINVVATPKRKITKEEALAEFHRHPRIHVVKISEGFASNTALFQFSRFTHRPCADMYEIAVYEETIGFSGDDITFAIYIPQEAVTIPETIDGIRASLQMQKDRLEAVSATNRHLGLEPKKPLY
ncbi:type II glyceraldehyde-3-phosphate dehydrogenase [Candidatus Hecatella orcuttiae]|jgi:glyceraldehyde-3-phosphate dehydrogenase (NAD(P))|uniref:type II glyceraldehyde-3-phosphate dehydrogenase n=1 Tax=Candidatus Hecatella orcuttiae TaxID=1935119 RepID=UPI002868085A|nr:type II glyceraldehyde-3-phosphate dehydrogenase [Candidatus Hecatella orcuttiae]